MKILIIQLARLGDIYQSWPVARSLSRNHKNSQIHFLVREKFAEALSGLEIVNKTHTLKTKEIVEDLLEQKKIYENENVSIEIPDSLNLLLDQLKNENYDLVINLTFSPLSSFFTYFLKSKTNRTLGYTRFSDSSFALTDSISSYYYSQVGIQKHNRFHLIDLFAALSEVDLSAEDFSFPLKFSLLSPIKESYITIQLGASTANKTLSPFIWSRVIKNLLKMNLNYQIVLLGSESEKNLADSIYTFNSNASIINLIGKTKIEEVFPILKNAALHIGGDSVFIHMCNLTQTPCLNLSFESVKFWETGPKSRGSFVLLNILPENTESMEVANAIRSILSKEPLPQLIPVSTGLPSFEKNFDLINDFEWSLVQSVYLDHVFPTTDDLTFFQAIQKLNDANELYIQTLNHVLKNGITKYLKIIESCDVTFESISKICPKVKIYTDWCLAEKIKVPPLTENQIVESYLKVHNELKLILKPYVLGESVIQEEGPNHG